MREARRDGVIDARAEDLRYPGFRAGPRVLQPQPLPYPLLPAVHVGEHALVGPAVLVVGPVSAVVGEVLGGVLRVPVLDQPRGLRELPPQSPHSPCHNPLLGGVAGFVVPSSEGRRRQLHLYIVGVHH